MPESKINGHGVRLLTSKFTVIPGGGGGVGWEKINVKGTKGRFSITNNKPT